MKFILCLLAFSFIFLFSCSDSGTEANPDAVLVQRMLDSTWTEYKLSVPLDRGGVAMYITKGNNAYFFKSGMAEGVNENYHFRAASNTKTFTAAAIMLLQQSGLLNINDLITANQPGKSEPYVPTTPEYDIPFKEQITIKLLLCHRAGVFDVTNSDIPDTVKQDYKGQNYLYYVMKTDRDHQFTFDELVGVNATNQLKYFKPDSGEKYSNTGYSILGKIIERISGKRYDKFIYDEFIVPNNLTKSYMVWDATDRTLPEPYVESYIYDKGAYSNSTDDNMSGNIAEGTLVTNLKDISRWVKLLMTGNSGVNVNQVAIMKQIPTGNTNYGLGIFNQQGVGWGHNGAHGGYLSYMLYDEESDMTFCIFTNIWNLAAIKEEMLKLVEILQKSKDLMK